LGFLDPSSKLVDQERLPSVTETICKTNRLM
jgi:hypothetical protein